MEQQHHRTAMDGEEVKSVWKQFVQNEQVLHFPKTIDGKIMIEVHGELYEIKYRNFQVSVYISLRYLFVA